MIAAANKSCELMTDIRNGKFHEAATKIQAGINPFETCAQSQMTPAHYAVLKMPNSSLAQAVMNFYLKNRQVDPNSLGSLGAAEGPLLPKSVEENFTIFQAALLSGDETIATKFLKKKGFDPNHRGRLTTAQGVDPETPLALAYFRVFKEKERVLSRLEKYEEILRKLGATYSNCDVLADITDPDIGGTNLRSGPGTTFPVVAKIESNVRSKNRPTVLIDGFHMSGWFKVKKIFPAGYTNISDLNSCSIRTDVSSDAWVHGSLIDFRQLKSDRVPTDRIMRNVCFGETSIQILGSKRILRFETQALSNVLPDLDLSCER